MALRLEDLPTGFTLEDEEFTTNEEAAKTSPDGEEQGLADYARWGRLLGYNAVYSKEFSPAAMLTGGPIYIFVKTTLYEDAKGASWHLTSDKERLSKPEGRADLVERFKTENPDWQDVEFVPMSFVEVGDDIHTYQLTGEFREPESGLEVPVAAQLVQVRRGRGVGALMVASIQGPSPTEELEAMVRKLDQRIEEALTGQSAQSAPPGDRAGLESLLRSATPGLEQLPSGFALESQKFETNEEDAADRTELDPSLEDLEAWGRLLGYTVNYRRDYGDGRYVLLRLAVDVYKTAEGAARDFHAESAVPEREEFKVDLQQSFGASSLEIERISFPSLGEESNAFRLELAIPQMGQIRLVAHAIGVLRGYLTANIEVWGTADSTLSMNELETIARVLDERMTDAAD
jgi:uncharacterized protein with PIN domain